MAKKNAKRLRLSLPLSDKWRAAIDTLKDDGESQAQFIKQVLHPILRGDVTLERDGDGAVMKYKPNKGRRRRALEPVERRGRPSEALPK